MRYHLIQDGYYQKNRQVLVRMEKSCTLLVGMQNGAASTQTSTEVSQEIKDRTTS